MATRRLEVVITGDASRAKNAMSDVESRAGRMRGKLLSIGKSVATGLAIGGVAVAGGVALGLKSAVEAALESQKIARETERVVRTTGGAAGVSAKQVGDYATSLSKLTGVDDELIQSGENLLLTFTDVQNKTGKGNDIFNQATAAALDMSTALGTDMKGATIQVGKALNDPVKGITALSRAGVSFTDKQKAMIKWLAASGDKLGAQKIILKELGKEFGGAAAAAATPMDHLKVTIGNVQEAIGAKLIPIIDKVVTWLSDNLPKALAVASEFWKAFTSGFDEGEGTGVEKFAGRVRGVVDSIINAGKSAVEWWKQNWPSIKIAIAAVVDWIQAEALPRIKIFADGVIEKFQALVDWVKTNWPAFQEAIGHAIEAIRGYWNTFGQRILDNVINVWNIVYGVIQVAINLVQGIIRTVTAVINGDWGKAWDTVKETFGRVWGAIPGILSNALQIVGRVLSSAFDVWRSFVSDRIGNIVDLFRGIGSRIASVLGDIVGALTRPFRSAIDAIRRLWNSTLGGKGIHIPSIGPFGGADFSIPRLAAGGTATRAGLALVGERGPELLAMPQGASVIPLGRTSNRTTHYHITASDPRAVVAEIERYERSMAGATAGAE